MKYKKPKYLSIKSHSELSERWIQDRIADDPSIIGLGDLVLRDKERIQRKAGRLDLLLQDPDTKRRYEVELQLGATDEAHIIRTIEYWDIERKRYPQYEHCAVIIAENMTARFLNVISLFNGTLPIIAIQVNAVQVGEDVTLIFTRVLDELTRGLVDEDEDAETAPSDRTYWEKKGSKQTVKLADSLLEIAREFDDSLELKYNKHYIGLSKSGQPYNFLAFRPRKLTINLDLKVPQSDNVDILLDDAGFNMLGYDARWANYRLSLKESDLSEQKETLRRLIELAHQNKIQ